MFCKECGTQLADDSKFCSNCGKEVTGIVSIENVGSDPPKKKLVVVIAVGAILACIIAIGVFITVRNRTDKNTDNEITESISDTETYEITLSAGTYTNESNSITVVKDVDEEYSFNLFVYDDIGEYFFFAGNIDNDSGNYVGKISEDESGNFTDKTFSITPSGKDIVISSDDDSLTFICMKYQYSSEVDALEEDVSEYEKDGAVDLNVTDNGMDMSLKEGYYGYWDNDTEYMLSLNSDNTFMINVVGASSPILYGEGEYYYSEDNAYKADISECDDDFMRSQTIDILVIDENTLSLSAQYVQLNNAVQGTYQYAGSSPADVENLKPGNDMTSDSGILSDIQEHVPYVPVTANDIGANFVTTYDLSKFYRTSGLAYIDSDYCAAEDVFVYHNLYDQIAVGVKDNNIVFQELIMSLRDVTVDELDLPEEMYNVEPYVCKHSSKTLYCLIWKLDNAYYIIGISDQVTKYLVTDIFITIDLQYCNYLSAFEPINTQ